MSQLSRDREGLQLAKFFMDYCYSVSDMIMFNSPEGIIQTLKEYAQTICDDCGGAMCDIGCPVSKYIDDMDKWLKGEEKTIFAKDFSESHDMEEKQGKDDVK